MSELREKLRGEILDAEGALLVMHHRRGALFVVAPELLLVDVAVAIAEDDTELVGGWIAEGKLTRPDPTDVERWESGEPAPFRAVIVQPYVLAQRR